VTVSGRRRDVEIVVTTDPSGWMQDTETVVTKRTRKPATPTWNDKLWRQDVTDPNRPYCGTSTAWTRDGQPITLICTRLVRNVRGTAQHQGVHYDVRHEVWFDWTRPNRQGTLRWGPTGSQLR
jgi:hypothetical protein